ncbi:MAG TPA: ABC transporter permease [Candidatus Limnocylindrales bacterium]|nr:ABC transporter permease [Candidatus Limnocylindrales bacterium]
MIVLQVLTRLLAFVGKELVEVVRRPGAIVTLILGPFLILALFGAGYNGYRRPLDAIIVVPPGSGLPTDLATYQGVATGMNVIEVAADPASALQRLKDRKIDTVIVAPPDLETRFRSGSQSVIQIHINVVDPVQQAYAGVLAARIASEVNAQIIERAAAEGQQYAVNNGQPNAAQIPPEVIAQPTRAELQNDAPIQPAVIPFYGPAVLALILQHLAVTLVALSLVRERTSGVIELFRVSPISTWEVIVGKILAFGVLSAIISSVTVVLLVTVLHVPLLGPPALLAGVLALLTIASLALGLLVAAISDSERQAVQLSLLVLLASVFFSGFVLPVEEFTPVVRTIGYLLPVTHGIRLTQDLMLRGSTTAVWEIGALAAIGVVLLIVTWLLLRRGMTRA